MERFNPFATTGPAEQSAGQLAHHDPDPFSTSPLRRQPLDRSPLSRDQEPAPPSSPVQTSARASRYSTSFPDPFAADEPPVGASEAPPPAPPPPPANRSNSVTFVSSPSTEQASAGRATGGRQVGGFSSFLSRATSVTSSTVTDRVSGAVGSVRSAVDSISSQIQSAVPTNLNERFAGDRQDPAAGQQQQQSAASFLASKLAINQFAGASGANFDRLPVISRQRVVLLLDATTYWAHHFNQYRRLVAGLSPSTGPASALSSFFSNQFSSSSSSSLSAAAATAATSPAAPDGADLIEQADFRSVSVLANQTSSTATIFVSTPAASSSALQQQQQASKSPPANRTIRPEYVVVRQRARGEQAEHLRGLAKALNYCQVTTFEPYDIWHTFQDRQLIFARLLRVQRQLGKEHFPLIPQVYCQTHQDLLNYIALGSSVPLPCLVRTGHWSGGGKIRIDSLQMLRDFASVMATSGQSCTIEQFLETKCDLVVQRLGTSLKLFRRLTARRASRGDPGADRQQYLEEMFRETAHGGRQTATRQTSLGSGVLSSLISGQRDQQQQQLAEQQSGRRSSGPSATGAAGAGAGFERLSEVGTRYKAWVEAVAREFDNKLQAFALKIVVASNDREYIVGLTNCSMDFMGSQENQEEDRRSFVELIISQMNTLLPPKHSPVSRETSSASANQAVVGAKSAQQPAAGDEQSTTRAATRGPADKRNFCQAQTDLELASRMSDGLSQQQQVAGSRTASFGQLGNRSKSVSVNQSDLAADEGHLTGSVGNKWSSIHSSSSSSMARRGSDRSDRSDSLTRDEDGYSQRDISSAFGSQTSTSSAQPHQRQASLGQSFFDQTSTALSSFQKQSMSFFKRLDTSGQLSNTPPMSAKSDMVGGFERGFRGQAPQVAPTNSVSSGLERGLAERTGGSGGAGTGCAGGGPGVATSVRSGLKSRSMDGSRLNREAPPPKPPPPPVQSLKNRQSSLASHSSTLPSSSLRNSRPEGTATPNTTPNQSRQNSQAGGELGSAADKTTAGAGRTRMVRQNSALSAFEPYDPELRSELEAARAEELEQQQQHQKQSQTPVAALATGRPSVDSQTAPVATNYDAASLTSGDSNSTGETAGEDTMNNLKKTFASLLDSSIFGDKCE